MPKFEDVVRTSSANLNLAERLQQPVTELIGVGPDAGAALESIAVKSIFDLGSSLVFASASAALAAASSDLNLLASDVLDDATPAPSASGAGELLVERLRSLSPSQAAALTTALGVTTIRDLAHWPPRRLAQDMVSTAVGASISVPEDTAEELRPRLGEYPTERVYYDNLVMFGTRQEGALAPLTQALSLRRLADSGIGFGAPAIGAIATYAQSWFAQGVTLGHMVHSLALAPGEATRIAIVDWARRTSASVSESIEESEQLDDATVHARAVSEVQNAVAEEMQAGRSMATGWSKSTSKASGYAGSIGGGIAGAIGSATGALGFGAGGSSSKQESETNSLATSSSWSMGSRSVQAGMNQTVNDRTEQHATSVRNRRASAVREVSQSEHEQVSTRIVANYNHMHALTIQYYEVVQLYRVSVRLNHFVRALFLPFEMLDFTAADAMDQVARFRDPLLAAALTQRAAQLLFDDRGRVEVRRAVRVPGPITVGGLSDVRVAAMIARAPGISSGSTSTSTSVGTGVIVDPVHGSGDASSVDAPAASAFSRIRAGPIDEVLPGDAKLVSVAFEDVGIDRVRIDQTGVSADDSTFMVPPTTDQIDLADGLLLRAVQGISVARNAQAALDGSMVLHYESDGHPSIAVVPLSLLASDRMQKVAFFNADTADRRAELLAHLQSNRGYYTRAVLATLDAASLVQLLAGLSWEGKPLADQVEPRPVAVTGNYLVLRAPAEEEDASGLQDDQTWGQLLRDRAIDFARDDTRLVPIPTGGVFAEAVLGRSNSAEKLDITRFWNWQDSPIPMQPPEISPVATGTRATTEDLRPGALGTPVVNVMAPTTLPEPSGLAAVLGAIANGNMFRDMSGLAGTQAAAQTASAGTLQAGTEAGRIASENFKAATTQATEMGKAAADMWKVKNTPSADGSGKESAAKSGGISGEGARINHGKDLDARGVSGASGPEIAPQQPKIVGASSQTFGAASDVAPPSPIFSRELAYSDESAAVSPQLIGATTAALGSVAATGSGLAAFLGSSNPISATTDVLKDLGEGVILALIREDSRKAGIAMPAKLLPMRLHRNHADFEPMYMAWTNSANDIYFNTPMFANLCRDMVAKGSTLDQAISNVRALAVMTVRHEEEHAQQFAINAGHPPASFTAMIAYEASAYATVNAWLYTDDVQDFLQVDLNADPDYIDSVKQTFLANEQQAKNWKDHPPANLQQEMKNKTFLPRYIGGNASYTVSDMYRT